MPEQESPAVLRQQIEEAVEQLRYSVIDTVASMADDGSRLEVGRRDVVDVDRLNSELDRIFAPVSGLPQEEILPPPAVERASLDLLVRDLGARAKALRSHEVLRLKRELALLRDRVAYLEARL